MVLKMLFNEKSRFKQRLEVVNEMDIWRKSILGRKKVGVKAIWKCAWSIWEKQGNPCGYIEEWEKS